MFLRISVVPPSIVLPRARSSSNDQRESVASASGPSSSTASSVARWLASDHIHFVSEPSGPGWPYFICAVRPR